MKVNLDFDNQVLSLTFTLDALEGPDYLDKSRLGSPTCEIHLPEDWSIEQLHPDVLALAIILIIYPFMNDTLLLPFGVSKSFHRVFKKETKKSVLPIDPTLQPRTAPDSAVPALAFSGGIDSTAALTILPENTACFFLDRIFREELEKHQKKPYNKQAVYFAIEELRKRGRQVYAVPTDLEYVRKPRGFPVELSTTIPALLLADYVGIDSVATGSVLETLYLNHKRVFNERLYAINWFPIFAAVGIHLNQVVAGISEVGTMTIVSNSPNRSIAQWCMGGDGKRPCLNCDKCFRKYLLQQVVLGKTIPDSLLDQLFQVTKARTMLKKFPIHYENVFTFVTSHYEGNHQLMNLLKRRTRGDLLDTTWMKRWYTPAKDQIYEKYYQQIKQNIEKYLKPMTDRDMRNMSSWNIQDVVQSTYYQQLHAEFVSQLLSFKQNQSR